MELVIESKHFHAHRIILAARSEYFRALFYGGLRESQDRNQVIELKECKAEAFELLLAYIYTGKIRFIREKVMFEFDRHLSLKNSFQENVLLDLLGLVRQYGFDQLETSLSTYLKSILSLNNVCLIYDTSCLYDLPYLRQYCAQFIDNHANEIIRTNEFLCLSLVRLILIVEKKCAREVSSFLGRIFVDSCSRFILLSGNRDLQCCENLA